MIGFFQTPMGKRFFEGTVPDLVVQLKRIANGLDRILDVLDAERSGGPATAEPATRPAAGTEAREGGAR